MERTETEVLIKRTRTGEVEKAAALHTPLVFQALLRHERSRSNRDSSEFSLAVFDVSGMKSDSHGLKQITCHMVEEMRSIDEVGWLDARNIGVLLPVTNLQGGRRFAARVSQSIPKGSLLPWKVYTYPSSWPTGADDNHREESKGPDQTGGIGTQRAESSRPSARHGANESHCADILGHVFCLRVPAWKRWMDIAGSLILIALLSPLFLLISIYIKTISSGRIFFRQTRVGYQGRTFTFMKFRTMHENNDPCIHKEHLKELIRNGLPMGKLDSGSDPRIIPGGRILRKACLDELPQLFNVLRGEMSLVGPRPCIPYEAEEYLRWHTNRFDILPGMTGLWQVSGKNKLTFEQMIRLDMSYMRRMSFLFDLKILLLTIPTIFGFVLEAGLKKLGKEQPESAKEYFNKSGEKGSFGNA